MNAQVAWILVAISYSAMLAFTVCVFLQMASGYSSSFLGWVPPNSPTFRESVGIAAFAAIVVSTLCGGIVWAWGHGDWPRMFARLPAAIGLLILLASIIGVLT